MSEEGRRTGGDPALPRQKHQGETEGVVSQHAPGPGQAPRPHRGLPAVSAGFKALTVLLMRVMVSVAVATLAQHTGRTAGRKIHGRINSNREGEQMPGPITRPCWTLSPE